MITNPFGTTYHRPRCIPAPKKPERRNPIEATPRLRLKGKAIRRAARANALGMLGRLHHRIHGGRYARALQRRFATKPRIFLRIGRWRERTGWWWADLYHHASWEP